MISNIPTTSPPTTTTTAFLAPEAPQVRSLANSPTTAQQATCSCGKRSALQCNCERASTENSVEGPRCSCTARPAGQCTCERASVENQKSTGGCPCAQTPAGCGCVQASSEVKESAGCQGACGCGCKSGAASGKTPLKKIRDFVVTT